MKVSEKVHTSGDWLQALGSRELVLCCSCRFEARSEDSAQYWFLCGGALSGLGGEESGSLIRGDVFDVLESGALERVGKRGGKS